MVNPASGQSQSISDPLFKTQDQELAQKWDAVQTCQVDFAFNQEVAVYYSSEEWQNAKSVLDLGSGNGYYLGRIASLFPEKEYTGVDLSKELSGIAEQERGGANRHFFCQDVYEVTGNFDFVIMRLFLQHVQDPAKVLICLSSMVKPGGGAIIIDSIDSARLFKPEVPEFRQFFRVYKEQQKTQGFDRNVASSLLESLRDLPEWTIGWTREIVIPSTIPGNFELFKQYYTLMMEIVEKAGQLEVDFPKVRKEWASWGSSGSSFTQLGLKVIQLVRT